MITSFLSPNSSFQRAGKAAGALSLFLLVSTTACSSITTETSSDGLDPLIEEPVDLNASDNIENDIEANRSEASTTNFAITGTGFQLIVDETGASESFEFGSESGLAKPALTKLWGAPEQSSEDVECPAGSMTITRWPNGFSVNEMAGNFIGWSIYSDAPGNELLTTTDGVGIGSSLSDLDPAADIISDSTLGIEFYTGEFSGLIDVNSPDATILSLWAGTSCHFR